jgi:asparagine synthase (glutamine-hydrolysing)
MSKAAAQHATVILTGAGGDELFFGYGRYHLLYRYARLLQLPEAIRHAVSRCASTLSPIHPRLRTLAALCSAGNASRVLAAKNGLASPWLWNLNSAKNLAESLFPPGESLFLQARRFDLLQTLPASYIPALERGSMRASLELRTPYLSRPLVEVLSRIDPRRLVAFGQKRVLRQILERYVPASLIDAPKQGFVFPETGFLAATTARVPHVPPLSEGMVREVWSRRNERNWRTLAVRLTIAEAWLAQTHRHERDTIPA